MNFISITHISNGDLMNDELVMYMDLIIYLKEKDVYKYYGKHLEWRILKAKQDLVLNKNTYDKYLSFNPECHKHIWSCPFINFKLKVMMWSLIHKLSFIARFMLFLRFLRHGKNL